MSSKEVDAGAVYLLWANTQKNKINEYMNKVLRKMIALLYILGKKQKKKVKWWKDIHKDTAVQLHEKQAPGL